MYLFLVGLSISLALVTYARAEDKTTLESSSPTISDQTVGKQSAKTERKGGLSEGLQNRIINLSSNVESRFKAVIERFENIANRLESRIEKLKTSGVETSASEATLVEVRDSLSSIRGMIEDVSGEATTIGAADNPREAFRLLRAKYLAIGSSLRESHRLLRVILAELKDAVRESEIGNGVSSAVQNENASEGDAATGTDVQE